MFLYSRIEDNIVTVENMLTHAIYGFFENDQYKRDACQFPMGQSWLTQLTYEMLHKSAIYNLAM